MNFRWTTLPALLFCVTATAATTAEPNFWGGLGGGAYTGKNYPPDGDTYDPNHNDVGGYSVHGSFNFTGPQATFRIRQSEYFGFTSNTADETAIEAGLPLAWQKKLWIAAGVSRLSDVSNTRKSPTIGFPLELDLYPVRGLELMIHANFNKDDNFVGFGIGGAIGRRSQK